MAKRKSWQPPQPNTLHTSETFLDLPSLKAFHIKPDAPTKGKHWEFSQRPHPCPLCLCPGCSFGLECPTTLTSPALVLTQSLSLRAVLEGDPAILPLVCVSAG